MAQATIQLERINARRRALGLRSLTGSDAVRIAQDALERARPGVREVGDRRRIGRDQPDKITEVLRAQGFTEDDAEEQISKLRDFLRSKGLSEDDVRTACDQVAHNLARGLRQPFSLTDGGKDQGKEMESPGMKQSDVLDPAKLDDGSFSTADANVIYRDPAKDRDFMTAEEQAGLCPYAGDRRMAGDTSIGACFEGMKRIGPPVWGFSPVTHEIESAQMARAAEQRARRTGRARPMALDSNEAAAAAKRFDQLYPDVAQALARIGRA